MAKKSEKWRRFESVSSQIQKTLSPDCEIEQNAKIRGVKSGRLREIDIVIKKTVGQFETLFAIDCKDYKKPANIKIVEASMGLFDDIQATQGAIISASGFSASAKKRAAEANIKLYRLVDAEKHDWQSYVAIPALADFRNMQFSSTFVGQGTMRMPLQDPREIVLYDNQKQKLGTTLDYVYDLWRQGEFPTDPGIHEDILLSPPVAFIKADNDFFEIELKVTLLIERDFYFGEVSLVEIKGFEDQITGALITNLLETEILDTAEVQSNWKKISSEDELDRKPILRLIAQSNRLKNTGASDH